MGKPMAVHNNFAKCLISPTIYQVLGTSQVPYHRYWCLLLFINISLPNGISISNHALDISIVVIVTEDATFSTLI